VLISCQWIDSLLAPASNGAPLDYGTVAEMLTSLGLEVEGSTRVGEDLEGIVVAEVRAQKPHPDAGKLTIVEIHDGRQIHEVVCGAPNVPPAGGKVIFAPVGTVLPGGPEIRRAEIRGVASAGMICSEAELDVGPDADGIMVVHDSWVAGSAYCDMVPGARDTILELSVTPNRPDALGHVGVARDLGVRLGRRLAPPELRPLDLVNDPRLVSIEAPDRCGRYFGIVFDDVRVGPSPQWLRLRLHRLGLRPIANVVDITNLVLLEWGQPLHAFDRGRLAEGRVVVRMASDAEAIETLDGHRLELAMDDLAICDAERPQALAGVIGGAMSGVDADTSGVLLEAAYFAPEGIRRTARRHGIPTESSYRFERGVDHGRGLERAVLRACNLLEDLAGARGIAQCEACGQRPRRRTVPLRPTRVRLVLGMPVPAREAERILTGLDIEVATDDAQRWQCVVPTHRPDIAREEDLIEELLRHYGLDQLPAIPSLPTALPDTPPASASVELEARLTDALREAGLHEVISLAFDDPERLSLLGADVPTSRAVRLSNPMRSAVSVMRMHLLPGLLDALAINVARHNRPVRVFEVGRIYRWPPEGTKADVPPGPTAAIDGRLPQEIPRAGVLLYDGRSERGEAVASAGAARELAGILLQVLGRLGLEAEILPRDAGSSASYLHPGVQVRLMVAAEDGVREAGVAGELHPDLIAKWDLPSGTRAHYGEIHIDLLPPLRVAKFSPLPRFPATSRDVSLEVPQSLPSSVVIDALREAAAAIDQSGPPDSEDPPRLARGDEGDAAVEVVEDYRGEGISTEHKALLVRLYYRAGRRSVTDAEVQLLHDAIVSRACEALAAAAPGIRRR